MATLNLMYRSRKPIGNLTVRLLYRHEQIDYVVAGLTNIEVDKNYWTKDHNRKTKDITIINKQNEINNEFNKLTNYILKAFNNTLPKYVNKEWLTEQLNYYYNTPIIENKKIPLNLIDYINFYIDYRQHEIKETSIKKYNVIKNKLIRFEKHRKKPILIKEVNDNFKQELVDYLIKEGYAPNTMQRELVFIKTFCKHARFLGVETSTQLDGLRLDRVKVEKVYLNTKEIEVLENFESEELTESLINAKDWLIISCYTGQRISDFMRFNKNMIRIENSQQLIEFTQKKTNKIMTVPIHPKVKAILDKRNGDFPRPISDQKYNDYIKLVCKIANLTEKTKGSKKLETKPESKKYRKKTDYFEKWELVSSHIGRRSFATNFYGKIPTSYLIYVTGHSTEKEFLNYIGKSNKDLALEMNKYFQNPF